MRIPLASISAAGLTLMTVSIVGHAQEMTLPPPADPSSPLAPAFDPRQFPVVRGELDRLTLTARGDIDGFIMKDGTEVKTAPALSTQIAFAIKTGDRVTVHGLKAAALPLVSAVSITDEVTHRTVTDLGVSPPMGPPPPPAPRGGAPQPRAVSETSGHVRMVLHGPQGEVNGVLLESGAILRFPADQSARFVALLQPHQALVAEGPTMTSAMGTVVDVERIGSSRDRLVAIRAASPPSQSAPQPLPPLPPPAS